MILQSNTGKKYNTDKQVGKGGEGSVHTVMDDPSIVIKIYNDSLQEIQFAKLKYMAGLRNDGLENYTAWPKELVFDAATKPVGFIMRRLDNYFPLHMLFNPMDRKRLFADKGYNFLLHVARNLCSAFHSLHLQNVIVGDINEGNIVVNAKGMIAFIDCDSFQIKHSTGYYFCEVGIPRYTPPELLRQNSFNNIIRTEQTDSFSLSILIFQLLFLGRHPFAGKNNSNLDIDEDTAIRNHEFAYSFTNKNKRLSPPDAAFKLQYLPQNITDLFHRAFEHEQGRPSAEEWIKSLDSCLQQIKTCRISKTHTYPAQISFCPWCDFKNRLGIIYFWDENFIESLQSLGDIDTFINGFKLKTLPLKELTAQPNAPINVVAAPIDPKYEKKIRLKIAMYVAIALATAIAFFYVTQWAVFFGLSLWMINRLSSWYDSVGDELKRKIGSCATFAEQRYNIIEQYQCKTETNKYNNNIPALSKLIEAYRYLPRELMEKKRSAEEQVYKIQLNLFLDQFHIADHKIEMFGASKKLLLYTAGIRTAADIEKLDVEYIKGIGPKNITYLEAWKRQVQSGFVYKPDADLLNQKFAAVAQFVASKKQQLETDLRIKYQEMLAIKNAIEAKQLLLTKQFNDIQIPIKQAEVDLAAFQKLVNKYKI